MKRKLLSIVVALSMTSTMTMPVFAAAQPNNTQITNIPVVGNIGRWKDGNTNITNPSSPDSGSSGENGEIQKPSNVTDINVTVPTSMTFDVVTNTSNSEPAFASAEYTVTNNGINTIDMTGQYIVNQEGGINLVDKSAITSKGDRTINLALDLNYGNTTPNQAFITNVKNQAKSSNSVTLGKGLSTKLQFTSDASGMADVKQEALAGTFASETKTTTGTLVLTFQVQ